MSTTETILQTDLPQPSTADAFQSAWSGAIPMVLVFVVFYFLLIRPQDKKRREQEKLIESVKKGETIVTNSGIFGKVVDIDQKEGTLNVEIANNTEVKILKSAVANITSRKLDNKETDKTNNKKKTKSK